MGTKRRPPAKTAAETAVTLPHAKKHQGWLPNSRSWEEARKGASSETPEGALFCRYLEFERQASKNVRK